MSGLFSKTLSSTVFTLVALAALSCSPYTDQPIRSGEIRPDDRGEHINAHGGGILCYDDTFYWF